MCAESALLSHQNVGRVYFVIVLSISKLSRHALYINDSIAKFKRPVKVKFLDDS